MVLPEQTNHPQYSTPDELPHRQNRCKILFMHRFNRRSLIQQMTVE